MKNSYRLQTMTFKEGDENQYTERKTESFALWGFGNGISVNFRMYSMNYTTLCIQFFDRENNNKNTILPLGKEICFTIVWAVQKFFRHFLRLRTKKSTTERFATGWFKPFTWNISSVGKDQVNNWEFCMLKIRLIVFFFVLYCFNAFFHLEP